MAFSTYQAFTVVEPITGSPVRAKAGRITDAETGEPVQLFDMNDVPIDFVVTNNYGYCEGFKTDIAHPSVLADFDGVEMLKVSSEVLLRAWSVTVSNIALDTDGVPYFSPGSSTVRLAQDVDGVPYYIPV